MAGTGTRRAPKSRSTRRYAAAAGVGIALPVVGSLAATAAHAYTVEKGDTLSEIAEDNGFGADWQRLYEANKAAVGDNPHLILPGQELDLDGKKQAESKPTDAEQSAATTEKKQQRYVGHTVAAGETLSKIAAKYDVPGGWQRVYVDNKKAIGDNPAALKVGTELRVDTEGGKVSEAVDPNGASSSGSSGGATEASQASVPTTESGIQAAAREIVPADQFTCFSNIVERESGWDHTATNPSSGAYGLMQALPGDKMASAGADWRTNPVTQLKWGLDYMNERYGSPCGAWEFWQANNWY
ncbi:LysM peptidoglycan-binding domain-containing protein [Streptomyces sp. WMMC500]|uniref:aggregation-promoting factor C-terminal-like domain-containing protein n=1 Tax=Streptomyces sp. WMMC500 TaxID=3015154 RepID=UPI00248D3463|nr:LysM peptidoglycan-binding domain-containing protein [Streptomyces sp. WMMC500]WBB60498.1 LysM peptidoglycan-binding domain-containing protein [Streptomyces sp. WMMC500]